MGILDPVSRVATVHRGSGVQTLLVQQLISYLSKPERFAGLSESFEEHGLGHILHSWVGTGQNLPISPAQVQQVLGGEVIAEMVRVTGLGATDIAERLASLLPQVMDKASPEGKEPSPHRLGIVLSTVGRLFS